MQERMWDRRARHGAIPVTVSAAQSAAGARLIQGPARLAGWSLWNPSGITQSLYFGQVTTPGAGATIATTPALAAGEYRVTLRISYEGTPAASDNNNMQWLVSGVVQQQLEIHGGSGANAAYGPFDVSVGASGTISVQAIGAGTAGAVYAAQIEIEPAAAIATLLDGAQVIGIADFAAGNADTHHLGKEGVRIDTELSILSSVGAIAGVVYVAGPDYPAEAH
jgi:hypothetical protein